MPEDTPPAAAAPPAPAEQQLADEEAAVYDRQLRVWGVEVQRKLTAARVLIVGFGQLAAEVAKNITLAGVGNLALLDDSPAASHTGRSFLVTPPVADGASCAEAASKALQAMNPLICVTAAPGSTADLAAGGSGSGGSAQQPQQALLAQQDLVIAVGLPLLQVQALDAACRAAGVGFMAAAAAGPAGWFFLDLGEHTFTPKDSKLPQVLTYSPFDAALSAAPGDLGPATHPLYYVLQACWQLEQQLGRPLTASDQPAAQEQLAKAATGMPAAADAAAQLLQWQFAGEAAPVCAVLGGVIANNVVAAVSGSSAPLHNLLYYSLADSRAIVEHQPPAAAAAKAAAAAGHAAPGQQQAAAEVVDID